MPWVLAQGEALESGIQNKIAGWSARRPPASPAPAPPSGPCPSRQFGLRLEDAPHLQRDALPTRQGTSAPSGTPILSATAASHPSIPIAAAAQYIMIKPRRRARDALRAHRRLAIRHHDPGQVAPELRRLDRQLNRATCTLKSRVNGATTDQTVLQLRLTSHILRGFEPPSFWTMQCPRPYSPS